MRLSFFSMRPAQAAHVIPEISRSIAVIVLWRMLGAHGRVAGLIDGGQDRGVRQLCVGGDDQRAVLRTDLDGLHAGDLADLFADRRLAVGATHASDVVGGGGHGVSFTHSNTPGGYA